MEVNHGAPLILTTITDEHIAPLEVLCERLKTNLVRGMFDKQARSTLKETGKNKFGPPRRKISNDIKQLFRGDEKKSKNEFSKAEWKRIFGNQLPVYVTVIRDGVRKEIFSKHIVIGDLIELKENNVVPADIRLIDSQMVVVDNRLITGNSSEIRTHKLSEATADCLVSPNMIFACTKILQGTCVGVVLRTGEDTVFGTLKNFATKVKIGSVHKRYSM